jgi:hypothetical protein
MKQFVCHVVVSHEGGLGGLVVVIVTHHQGGSTKLDAVCGGGLSSSFRGQQLICACVVSWVEGGGMGRREGGPETIRLCL